MTKIHHTIIVKRYGLTKPICDSRVELVKDGKTWFIRKGSMRDNCVVDELTKKDLMTLMVKIDKILCREE